MKCLGTREIFFSSRNKLPCVFSSEAFKNSRNDAVGMTAGANIPEEILHAKEKLKGLLPPTTHGFMLASISKSILLSTEKILCSLYVKCCQAVTRCFNPGFRPFFTNGFQPKGISIAKIKYRQRRWTSGTFLPLHRTLGLRLRDRKPVCLIL